MSNDDKVKLIGVGVFVAGVAISAFVGISLLGSGIQDGLTFVTGGYTDAWTLTWAIVKTSVCVPLSFGIFSVASIVATALIKG